MKKNKILVKYCMYYFVFLIVLLCLSGTSACSKKPEKSPPQNESAQKKESNNLIKLQESIEVAVKEFEKVYLAQTAPPPNGQSSGSQGSGQENEQSGGKGQEQSTEGEQDSGKKSDSKGQKGGQTQEVDWPKMEKFVTEIHTQWNNFQSEAVKAGATIEMTDSFSAKLNELTVTLTEQQLYEGIIASNGLYEKSVAFEGLFKVKSPPDIRRVLYYLRDAVYRSLKGEQGRGLTAIEAAMSTWETVKQQLDDVSIANKLEYSLKELKQAIIEKDPNLIKIKASIGEKNIQDAIKEMEKQTQK